MNIKNKEKVLKKLKSPSKNKLSNVERISVASGGALLTFAATRFIKDKNWAVVLPLFVAGGALTFFGFSGKNPLKRMNKKTKKPLKVKTSVVIGKSPEEVYNFWRQLENLPFFMNHIKDVRVISATRSHWRANMHSADMTWEAEITEDKPGRVIAWRSLPDSAVQTAGKVVFKDAAGGRGTELMVTLRYADDTGQIAKAFASLYKPVFSQQVREELRNCKRMLEAGELPDLKPEPNRAL